MKKNFLLVTLAIVAIVAIIFALFNQAEARRMANLGQKIEKECLDAKVNAHVERERQYQMALHLTTENEELKRRLKNCGK